MHILKRTQNALAKFFFPPSDASRWVRILPYAVLGLLTVLVLAAGAYGWEYTNSPMFCGTSCHTMPPEYTAYLTSPHARIACVDCHIGRDFIATQITRKAGDIRHVVFTLFKSYEFPITANDMRPARESCEKCHFPEKFSDDSLREIKTFASDSENTPSSIFLVLKTGGGSSREGLGLGIHWHIENKIYYYPTGIREQEIPYIRVQEADGTFTEYVDLESGFDPASITETDLEEMDCITCHNRITHLVNQPETSIDKALSLGSIDPTIPDVRRLAVDALRADYQNKDVGMVGIAGIENYYTAYHPEYYQENQPAIQQAIAVVQEIYDQSVYPEQKSDWDTHANNIGHRFSPGCFRCHDGKHLNEKQEAIRLECNLCHSIPVVAGTQDFVTDIEISRGPEPQTHLNPNWISLHRDAFDASCQNCHTTENPGGIDNTSFCSNSACHGNIWEYAGFDAPGLRELLMEQLPETVEELDLTTGSLTYSGTIGSLFQARCSSCHGEGGLKGLNVTTYASLMAGSENGTVIIPGDANTSLLVQVQSGSENHFGQFTPQELSAIIEWINAGAPEK
jgi:nitrate/TMAO reductase-like tetraheme cytochrome c subunit